MIHTTVATSPFNHSSTFGITARRPQADLGLINQICAPGEQLKVLYVLTNEKEWQAVSDGIKKLVQEMKSDPTIEPDIRYSQSKVGEMDFEYDEFVIPIDTGRIEAITIL